MFNWTLIIGLIFNTIIFHSSSPISNLKNELEGNYSQQSVESNEPSDNKLNFSTSLNPQSLAKCLTDKGVIMYGAYWCPHCANQKELFGSDFQFIKYQECDPSGENGNPEICENAGVEAYPTWIDSQGNKLSGTQPLETLANWSNCNIN